MAEGYRRSWRAWRASIPAKGWLQQPNPTPDQTLTLLPSPQNPPRHEYDGLALDLRSPGQRPKLVVPQHGVENCQQLAHHRNECHAARFAGCAQAPIKGLERWIVPDGG